MTIRINKYSSGYINGEIVKGISIQVEKDLIRVFINPDEQGRSKDNLTISTDTIKIIKATQEAIP